MRKVITGINKKGQEVEVGKIMMKYQVNSDLDRPVLVLLRLKNEDSFFFKYESNTEKWILQKNLCFLSLESPLIEIYHQMDVTGDIYLDDFREMLFLKYFRHQPPNYEQLS